METSASRGSFEKVDLNGALARGYCGAELHDGIAPEMCLRIDGRDVCANCLADVLLPHLLSSALAPTLAYLLSHPKNELPPPSCDGCPFRVPHGRGGTECQMLGEALLDTQPVCEWDDWQRELASEVGKQ